MFDAFMREVLEETGVLAKPEVPTIDSVSAPLRGLPADAAPLVQQMVADQFRQH